MAPSDPPADDPVLAAARAWAQAAVEAWIARMGGGDLPRSPTDAEVAAFAAGGPVAAPDGPARARRAREAREDLQAALASARESGEPAALDRLAARLGLDPACRDATAFLWALHRTPALAAFAVRASAEPEAARPSVRAVAAWTGAGDEDAAGAVRAALAPGGALRVACVADAGPGDRGPVVLDAGVAAWLDGASPADLWPGTDGRPRWIPAATGDAEGPADEESAPQGASVRAALAQAARRSPGAWRLAAHGSDGGAVQRQVAREVARSGRPVLAVRAEGLARDGRPDGDGVGDALGRALRDALLCDAALCLEGAEALLDGDGREDGAALRRLAAHPGPLVLASTARLPGLFRWLPGLAEALVPPPVPGDVVAALEDVLGDGPGARDAVRQVAGRFGLTLDLATSAALEARARAAGGPVSASDLEAAVRRRLAARRGALAITEEATRSLDDLFLPPEARDRLEELISNVRYRERVLEDWGFGARIPHARGVSALFHGPPGTGKTLAAGIVASTLGLETWRIDLSRVVDKYIGETEKHLAKVFDEARRGEVLLLFDEADSLFAKRTGVQSATDRYANLEVNYLLQRMERYDGVVVLTTNSEHLLDEAFKRRLRHRIGFPMPDPVERAALWRGLLPPGVPREGEIDYGALADAYEMSGGHVRNAVLRACFLAAESGGAVTQATLRRAADLEYRELGKLVRQAGGDRAL